MLDVLGGFYYLFDYSYNMGEKEKHKIVSLEEEIDSYNLNQFYENIAAKYDMSKTSNILSFLRNTRFGVGKFPGQGYIISDVLETTVDIINFTYNI